MRIAIVTPGARHGRHGNRVTALRWALFLRRLGHSVSVAPADSSEPPPRAELLVALHAERSADLVRAFHSHWPERPVVVAVTGTDVYGAGGLSAVAEAVLRVAARIVVLQPRALRTLPEELRARARVVVQSAAPLTTAAGSGYVPGEELRVVSLAHLRPVKDPLLGARAVALLAPDERIAIEVVGAALDPELAEQAAAAAADDRRWRWIGPLPRPAARARLAQAHLALSTSRSEGGAGFLSEALASGVPPVVTDAEGNLGLLGDDWPARYPRGDAEALAGLLERYRRDAAFRARLAEATGAAAERVRPELECEAWRALLAELA